MCVKTVLSAFAPCGTNTTSENSVRREASAASTLSPALTSEMGFTPPDSSVTVSEPAKQDFREEEEEVDDTAATGVDGNLDGSVEEGADGVTIVALVR